MTVLHYPEPCKEETNLAVANMIPRKFKICLIMTSNENPPLQATSVLSTLMRKTIEDKNK